MDEGALAILLLFGLMPALFVLPGPIKQWLAQRERREARQLYERLTMEKLDVIKTAVAVGMDKHDLADLDDKLERLIGVDQMQTLLLNKEPHAPEPDELPARMSSAEREAIYGSRGRKTERG